MSKFAINNIDNANLEHIRTVVLPAMEDKYPYLLFADSK